MVTLGRPRSTNFNADLVIVADIANEKTELPQVKNASVRDQERLLALIDLELARARVGYFGLKIPFAQQFSINKHIRISDYLNEEEFMRALWDIEAAVNSVIAVFQLWLKEIVPE